MPHLKESAKLEKIGRQKTEDRRQKTGVRLEFRI
jgi:hypothetical protein